MVRSFANTLEKEKQETIQGQSLEKIPAQEVSESFPRTFTTWKN